MKNLARIEDFGAPGAVQPVNGAAPAPAAPERLEERHEDPHGKAREALAMCGLSQTQAAREIGISDSVLSQWLSGQYRGNVAAVDAKVARWIEARAERAELDARLPAAPEWVETPTAHRIEAGLSYAHMAGDICVVYGGAGLGKTMTARRYAGRRPNAWIATMSPATSALGPCLERLAEACGVRATSGRPARIEADLRERLSGSLGLLIVDEAQHLSPRALEGLRSLHDATDIGLALLGNETIYARLTGGRRAAEFAQLFSRIGKRVRLTRPGRTDVTALLEAWSARQVLGRETRATALEIARRPGALRGLTKALRLAALFAAGQEEKLDVSHLREAWKDLGGEA